MAADMAELSRFHDRPYLSKYVSSAAHRATSMSLSLMVVLWHSVQP